MRNLSIFIFFLTISIVSGNTITVAGDGTGDFAVIQEAIESASDNDTILVYPGIYYENINYSGKTLVIGSLYMTTGEEQHINSTVIDGNENGRVVTVDNDEGEGTAIIGFVIRNGNAINGGGIYIDDAYMNVIRCIVKNNFALNFTGGVACKNDSYVFLSGTTIKDNYSKMRYGGLTINHDTHVTFDQEDLCSIYGNYAPDHCDIHICVFIDEPIYHEVYLDTFSCLEPDRYFIGVGDDGNNYNWEYLNLQVNTAFYDFYDGDLYVSPDGDDNNNGTSPDEPMKTIAWAITRTVSNPENPNTVHLLNGTYSPSLNDQILPLNMKAYVNLVGESMDCVIIDGEEEQIIRDFYSGFEYEISNMTLISEPLYFQRICWIIQQFIDPMQININNLRLLDSNKIGFWIDESIEFFMDNVIVEGGDCHFLTYCSAPGNHSIIRNCQESNSKSFLLHQNYNYNGDRARMDILNTLIVDNSNDLQIRENIWPYVMSLSCYTETNLINCTIMNNECPSQQYLRGCVTAQFGGNISIYNSCIYGNDGYQIAADTDYNEILGSTINVAHSLIEGGETGIPLIGNTASTLNWLYSNLDCDPMLDEEYKPMAGSPLIDAGTDNLPYGIELPETDLAGNQRVTGGRVDIGAYEYNPWGSEIEEDVICAEQRLFVYPNPAVSGSLRNGTVTLSWQGERKGDIQFDIYNAKGQQVRSVYSIYCRQAGIYQADWDLRNERGLPVSSGVFYVRFKQNEDYIEQQKFVVIR